MRKVMEMNSGFASAAREKGHAALHNEDGAMWPFAIVTIMTMVMGLGLGLNMMRVETERMRAQSVADTAVLAAASMGQMRDAREVVEDFFDKAGLSDRLPPNAVQVVSGINGKVVTVDTVTETDTFFANYFGYEAMRSTGRARAEEYRTDVEVVLVLDISGSMNSFSRIQNLKNAASDFVSELLDADTENRISVAVVPYNGQVNLTVPGASTAQQRRALYDQINLRFGTPGVADGIAGFADVTRRPGGPTATATPATTADALCIDMPQSQMIKPEFDQVPGLGRTPYTDYWSSSATQNNSYRIAENHNAANIWCPARNANGIRLPTNNKQALLTYINNFEAVGATSIDLGLKWGAWLLDPQAQPIMAALQNNTTMVSSHFADRPRPFSDPNILKVVVLMTDGEHFIDTRIRPQYRTGNPPEGEIRRVWENNEWRYSIRHDSRTWTTQRFWIPHLGTWGTNWHGGNNAQNVPLQQLWADHLAQWAIWQLWGRPLGMTYTNAVNMIREQTATTQMDQRMLQLCNTLKGRNVVIFGVAFEAPQVGQQLLSNCASSDRFFAVSGSELTNAFRKVRGQIVTLRLTQ
jgi:hypothetical protein